MIVNAFRYKSWIIVNDWHSFVHILFYIIIVIQSNYNLIVFFIETWKNGNIINLTFVKILSLIELICQMLKFVYSIKNIKN